jgi:hypothetical protein
MKVGDVPTGFPVSNEEFKNDTYRPTNSMMDSEGHTRHFPSPMVRRRQRRLLRRA